MVHHPMEPSRSNRKPLAPRSSPMGKCTPFMFCERLFSAIVVVVWRRTGISRCQVDDHFSYGLTIGDHPERVCGLVEWEHRADVRYGPPGYE